MVVGAGIGPLVSIAPAHHPIASPITVPITRTIHRHVLRGGWGVAGAVIDVTVSVAVAY